MEYFSPSRPRLANGLPMFMPHGEPLNVLPGLYMTFHTPGSVELSCFPSTDRNRASRKEITIPLEDLSDFVASWLADPEAVIISRFGWTRNKPPPQVRSTVNINLEDLDLNL